MSSSALKRNKDADFKILAKSCGTLLQKFSADENAIINGEQFHTPVNGKNSASLYMSDQGIEHASFIPLPPKVSDKYGNAECASFMGLIPEIRRAWITIDNQLHLWDYLHPEKCEVYDGLSEIILSVSLSAPKPGIFLDSIKYVIAIATTVEVTLVAISWDSQSNTTKLIPTAYRLPTDNVTVVKVQGSQSGRIFLAGNDGNLYELDYQSTDSPWSIVFGTERTHKCRKINHSVTEWKILRMLPPFLRSQQSANDSLVDLIVDNVRNVLYSTSLTGNIGVFYLGDDPKASVAPLVVAEFNVIAAAQKFSMDQKSKNLPSGDDFNDIRSLSVVGVYIVPLTESRTVHTVAFLNSGSRVYLRLFSICPAGSGSGTGPEKVPFSIGGAVLPPTGIEVVSVRYAPSADEVRRAIPTNREISSESGPRPLRFHTASYSHGLWVTGMERVGIKGGDHLLCLHDDPSGIPYTHRAVQSSNTQPIHEIMEYFCVPEDSTGQPAVTGKIHDLRESGELGGDDLACKLLAAYATSAITFVTGENDPYTVPAPLDHLRDPSECTAGSAQIITMAGRPSGRGLQKNNLKNTVTLGELPRQYIPCPSTTLKRQILCLTNEGLHILHRVRPIDRLYRIINGTSTRVRLREEYEFLVSYGAVESVCACLGIACGVPYDAGVSGPESTGRPPLGRGDRDRALRCLNTFAPKTDTLRKPEEGDQPSAPSSSADGNSDLHPVHEAFFLLASRLLRGVWLRAVPSSTALPQSSALGLGESQHAEPLSPCLWTSDLIASIKNPLYRLLRVLEDLYPVSLHEPVHFDKEKAFSAAVSTREKGTRTVFSKADIQSKVLVKMRRTIDSMKAGAHQDESLKGLHRLLSRCVQALVLVDLLCTVEREKKVGHSIPWDVLGKISFRSLVSSQGVHDKVKGLLARVLDKGIRDVERGGEGTADCLADQLSKNCFLYFSTGDRCMYEAGRTLEVIRASQLAHAPSHSIYQQISVLVDHLCQAAQYWVALSDVMDRSAKEESSELSKYCTILRAFGTEGREGMVTICSIASSNFGADPGSSVLTVRGSHSPRDWGLESNAVINLPSRAQEHYQWGSVLNSKESEAGRKACYACLLRQIAWVGFTPQGKGADLREEQGDEGPAMGSETTTFTERAQAAARHMIVLSLESCSDPLYRSMLYDMLLKGHVDTLLDLEPSQHAEEYLDGKEPDLLYRYFTLHKMFTRAASHMQHLSKTEADLDIKLRVEYFEKAVHSASQACASFDPYFNPSSPEPQGVEGEYFLELQRERDLARLQLSAFEELSEDLLRVKGVKSSGTLSVEETTTLKVIIARLKSKLLDISELFNNIAMPHKLWNICLVLMHSSGTRTQNPLLGMQLLRSIIYRNIPDRSDTIDGRAFLASKRTPSNIFFDCRRQETSVPLESVSKWLNRLSVEIIYLGSQIHGPLGDASLPFTSLIEELEEIASSVSSSSSSSSALASTESSSNCIPDNGIDMNSFPRGWAVDCALKMGVRYGTVIECQMGILDRWNTKIPEKHTHLLSSISYAFLEWRRHASCDGLTAEGEDLQTHIRSGVLQCWSEKVRSHVVSLSAGIRNSSARDKLRIIAEEVADMKKYSDRMTWSS